MGDLAARLRNRGLELPGEAPALSSASTAAPLKGASASLFAPSKASSGGASSSSKGASGAGGGKLASSAAPAPLRLSQAETRSLFTPLIDQGSKALREEQKHQQQGEDELLKGVLNTLLKWVQDCLVKEEKRDKLLEKGMLKCRVQAKWSERLHEKLKQLAGRYGARLAADGEKENAAKHPAWLPRNEKWLVGFDAAALEAFVAAHPEALDPPSAQVRAVAEDVAASAASAKAAQEAVTQALQARFGPLRKATLERARRIAVMKRGTKRKGGPGEGPEAESRKARIETQEDVAWAAATLAPMGLKAAGGEPVVKAPASLAAPVLEGLKALESMPDFVALLRETQIGKVVAGYRHHPKAELAKAAKDLVASWRAACKDR